MNRERLKTQLIRHEGLRLKPYRDTMGKLTIGVGRNLTDVGITEQEAMYLLENDITKAHLLASTIVPGFETLDDIHQEVLVNMAFNLGSKLQQFTQMLRAIQQKDFDLAAREMLKSAWAEQVKSRAEELAEQMRLPLDYNSRKIAQSDLKPRMRHHKPKIIPAMPEVHTQVEVHVPFYRRPGFKRGLGFTLMGAGYIFKHFIPSLMPLSDPLMQLGGVIGGLGILHAGARNNDKVDKIMSYIKKILTIILKERR